ncbi:MAG: hypothetical protein KY469_08375 [Actinobacteria bacterium]|nr:hypothetical protein [Actinomycetota bacterium]
MEPERDRVTVTHDLLEDGRTELRVDETEANRDHVIRVDARSVREAEGDRDAVEFLGIGRDEDIAQEAIVR